MAAFKRLFALILLTEGFLQLSASAFAATEKVLYTFQGGSDGAGPLGPLISDSTGNLYGTTAAGGSAVCFEGCGTVFQLTPDGSRGWNEKVLYAFTEGSDGLQPSGGLVFDKAGSLYGVTANGGQLLGGGYGTVYQLSPNSSGGWDEKVIYSFLGLQDGAYPFGGLVFDATGNVYGTTTSGGIDGGGTIFELSPNGQGGWTKSTILQLGSYRGAVPTGSMVFDSSGNLYGTAALGGTGFGVVFQLTPNSSGRWTEHVLYTFSGPDGSEPSAGIVFDSAGNLYGETGLGGLYSHGEVFELVRISKSQWKEKTVRSFAPASWGQAPYGGLAIDGTGNLYGTTELGGLSGCIRRSCGIAFELSHQAGYWSESVLADFSADVDGGFPMTGLSVGPSGILYGTTGGGSGTIAPYGTVFEIIP